MPGWHYGSRVGRAGAAGRMKPPAPKLRSAPSIEVDGGPANPGAPALHPSANQSVSPRFRRLRRWRWLWRLGGALLLVAGLAGSALFMVLPTLLRDRIRRELAAVGLEADLEVSRLTRRGLTLGNFSLGRQPGALRIARIEIDFSLLELRAGLIREVRLSGIEGVVARPDAGWTFAGLERFRPAAAAPAGPAAMTVRSLLVADSLATLELPNLPPLRVPFSAKAEAMSAGRYRFRVTLAPEQCQVILSGEFSPDLGSGRFEATARGVQARAWLPFIVLPRNLPYTLEQIDGSADLMASAIVDHRALVHGRADVELAGLAVAVRDRRPDGSRCWSASAPGASLAVDLVPAAEAGATRIPIRASLGIPRLDTPILPDLAVSDITVGVDYRAATMAATVGATVKLPLATLASLAGVSETGGTVLVAKLGGDARLDSGRLDFTVRATLPRQPLAVVVGDFSLAANAHATLELAGPSPPALAVDAGLEQVEARFRDTRWTADTLTLRKGEAAPADAKAAERLLRLDLANWAQDLHLGGKLLATGLTGQAGTLAITGGQIGLPLAWHGGQGFVTDGETPDPLSLHIRQLQFGKLTFHPGPFTGQATGRDMRWRGGFSDPGGALAGTVDAAFTLGAVPAGLLRATVTVGNLAALSWLPPLLPAPFGHSTMSGQAALAADVSIGPGGLSGTAEARLGNLDLALPGSDLAIRGLDFDLRFCGLLPPATPPHQAVTFRELTIGKLQFGPGRIDLQLPGDGRVFVENGRVGWCDGQLSVHALVLDPAASRLDLDIVADNLDLDLLLRRQDFVVGSGQGRLSGRLPFTIQDGRLAFGDCFLYAAPGSTGALRLSDATGLANLVPDRNDSKQTLQKIVADMEYSLLKIDLQGSGQPPELRISLEGASQTSRKLPPLRLSAKLQFDNNDVYDMITMLRRLKSMTGGN